MRLPGHHGGAGTTPVSPTIPWERYAPSAILSAALTAARRCRASLVAWREPGTRQLYLQLSFGEATRRVVSDRLPAGFVYSPFHGVQGRAWFLPAQLLLVFRDDRLLDARAEDPARLAHFLGTLATYLGAGTAHHVATDLPDEDAGRAAFLSLVARGLREIHDHALRKVVLARTGTVPLPAGFDAVAWFLRLSRQQPQHFVSLLSSPTAGTWVGCSPELLLAMDPPGMRTMALAGTVPVGRDWSGKEREEQALVSEFIRDSLRQLELGGVEEAPVQDMAVGHFRHLRNDFHIRLDHTRRVAGAFTRLLARLHPTPALCGLPRTAALAFIRHHEGFDRRLYGGYLGPCNIEPGHTRLYVNIRCMELLPRHGRLYLGAGITAESDPEAEWRETCLKSRTLLDSLAGG